MRKFSIILLFTTALSGCSLAPEADKDTSTTPRPDKRIYSTYDLGKIQFDAHDLNGVDLTKISFIRAKSDVFNLLNSKGETWKFKVKDKAAYKVDAPVDAQGNLFTLDFDHFWELRNTSVERSIASDDAEIESVAFEFTEQIDIADMKILGIDEAGLIGLKDSALFVMHFSENRIYVERLNLPYEADTNKGAGIFAAGIIEETELPWIWHTKGMFFKLENVSGWSKVTASFSGIEVSDSVSLGTKVSVQKDELSFKSDLMLLANDKLFKSHTIPVASKTEEEKEEDVGDWETMVKPTFENSCKSCHSNYTSKAAWVSNKCNLIDRINPDNKSTTKTMPPDFATSAQIEHMNEDDDKARKKLIKWLNGQDGDC